MRRPRPRTRTRTARARARARARASEERACGELLLRKALAPSEAAQGRPLYVESEGQCVIGNKRHTQYTVLPTAYVLLAPPPPSSSLLASSLVSSLILLLHFLIDLYEGTAVLIEMDMDIYNI